MALNNIQERIEVSIYEAIRLKLVENGYWPDEPSYPDDTAGNQQLEDATKAVVTTKGFAVSPWGYSGPASKGAKQVPRMVIIPRRFMPGDLGNPSHPMVIQNIEVPDEYYEATLPQQSLDFQMDIHLVTNTAKQNRVLNAILYAALGTKRFITFHDNSSEMFFLEQYNYYDLPDAVEGIDEKIYSYAVKDLFLGEEIITEQNVALIKEIQVEVGVVRDINEFTQLDYDGTLIMDLSGFRHLFDN